MLKNPTKILAGLLLTGAFVAGCALGDGRGFATIDGSLTVTMEVGKAVVALPSLDTFTVTIGHLQLDGSSYEAGVGTEHVTSSLLIGSAWEPLDGAVPKAFGPVEVERGPYSEISVVISQLDVSGDINGVQGTIKVAPPHGIKLTAVADLPVDRDELPLISITAVVTLPNNLLSGVDPAKGVDAAAAQIAANVASGGRLEATWIRRGD